MFEFTDEKLKEWKEKHGDRLFMVKVEDKLAVVRKPGRKDLSFATAGSSQGRDALKFAEILLKQCWIDGDKEIMEDDDYFLGAVPTLEALAENKKAEIKKL